MTGKRNGTDGGIDSGGRSLRAVLAALAVVVAVLGLGAAAVVAQSGTDLTQSDVVVSDVASGDEIVTDAEFSSNGSVDVSIAYNNSQTLTFETATGETSTLDVTAGDEVWNATLEANQSETENGTVWKTYAQTVEWPDQTGSLSDPATVDFVVSATGDLSALNQTDVSVDSGGFLGGVFSGGDGRLWLGAAAVLGLVGILVVSGRDG